MHRKDNLAKQMSYARYNMIIDIYPSVSKLFVRT